MHNIIQPPHHTCHNQYIHALHWCWINILRYSDLWIIKTMFGFTYPNHFLRIHSGKGQFRCCCCVIAVISPMRCQKTWSNKLYGPLRLNLSWQWHCLGSLMCYISNVNFFEVVTSAAFLYRKKKHQINNYTAKKVGPARTLRKLWVDSRASLTVQITFY